MISRFIKATVFLAVLAGLAITVSGVVPVLQVSFAEAGDSSSGPIDMDTDDDGNGIPDDFETAYGELLAELWEIDPTGGDLTDVSETQGYKLMAGFYDRLPVAGSTKAVLATTAEIFEKLAATDTLEKQQELVEKIREEEARILERDSVYVDVKGYMAEILSVQAGAVADSEQGANSSSFAGSAAVLGNQTLADRRISASLNVDAEVEEDNINRLGDLIFKETSAGQQGGFSFLYTMKWDHVAMYAGDVQVYPESTDGRRKDSGRG